MITQSALIAATLTLVAAGAQARDVYWSVGIHAPIQPGWTVGAVISNAPAYRPAPVYFEPAPMYYPAAPVAYAEPIYYRPARVVVLPQPYYAPRRVVYTQGWAPSYRGHGRGPKRGHWQDEYPSRGQPVMARSRER